MPRVISTRTILIALTLLGLAVAPTQLPSSGRAQESAEKKTWLAVAPGRIEPLSGEIRIGSPAIGRIGAILVKPTDTVFAGEALVRLDDDEVRLRHAKAEAQVNLHKRARTGALAGKAAERRKLEDTATDAERAAARAQIELDRTASARRAGKATDADIDKARLALSEARDLVLKHQAALAKFDLDSPTAAGELDSQTTLARIELRGAEAALDNLIIRAPIGATVLQVNVRPGELASPSLGQPLVVIGDLSALRVRAEIDERDFGEIRIGHAVVVRSGAFRGRDVAGRVVAIAPIIEPGRIGARGPRSVTDINVAEALIDLAEPGPFAVGMKVDVYFSRDTAKR